MPTLRLPNCFETKIYTDETSEHIPIIKISDVRGDTIVLTYTEARQLAAWILAQTD